MVVHFEIPDELVGSIRLPEDEVGARMRLEVAIAFYAQDILSLGIAAELSGISRYSFGARLAERAIPRHYGEDDLRLDLSYARGF